MMKERRVAAAWPVSGPIHDGAGLARTRNLETTAGTLFLQDHCQPSFVESLRVDGGLRAFARLPEREHQLLVKIAKRSDCRLTLAYTPEGVIVAEVTLAPGDAWWAGLEHVYEGAVQVSANWRRLGSCCPLRLNWIGWKI